MFFEDMVANAENVLEYDRPECNHWEENIQLTAQRLVICPYNT
jgi:hypothetical protein